MGAVGDAAAKLGATLLAPELERACHDWGIDTPEMQARFLAQCFVETRQFKRLVESFNYSCDGLRATFSAARIGDKDCAILGRHPGHAAEEQLIANKVYGGLWGRNRLGNTEPNDGWMFKGRGCAMVTGRDNYARCGEALNLDLLHHPEMLVQLRYAAQSAGWFWRYKKCADCADNKAVSIAWNGGSNALAERMAAYARAKLLLGEA